MRFAFILALGILIGMGLDRVVSAERAASDVSSPFMYVHDWVSRNYERLRDSVTGTHVGSQVRISGRAHVIDGDTLDIRGTRIRLYGIDAPESRQHCSTAGRAWACGQQASAELAGIVSQNPVSCQPRDRDRYGRIVAICFLGETDLNGWMVRNGWAFAYRQYSSRYVQHEESARAARRGIWRGEVVPPWDWRKGKRLPDNSSPSRNVGNTHQSSGSTSRQPPGKCHIKGNISASSGRRIYHMPGGRWYDETWINQERGERWFCTEKEARAAGWVPSGR